MTNRLRALALDRSPVTIDGRPLSAYGVVMSSEGWTIGEAKPATSYQSVPGLPGGVDMTLTDRMGRAYPDRRDITLHALAVGDMDEIDEAKRLIGALHGKQVALGGLTLRGSYRGRLSVGSWTDTWDKGVTVASAVELTVDADPYAYGERVTIPLVKGVNTLLVDGNASAPPRYKLYKDWQSAGGSNYHPHLLVTDADDRSRAITILVPNGADGTATRDLIVDCESHQATLAGARIPVSVQSDFFPFDPGIVRLDCEVEGHVTYTPRWFI